MDLCVSHEVVLQKRSAVETPRPPLVPAERNNGTNRRSRTREVSSRYKSPTPSAAPGARRSPSPNITRTNRTPSVSVPKRAISAERRRPSTPPSPSSPSTPVSDTSADMQLASRKMIGSRLPESLWPSTMRSLSVSFQSDSFSLPISKREKPVTHALSDRTLRQSSNVAHKQSDSHPVSRKPTPERKRSPLKGKNADQSENSKPADGLHSRLVDQHRWPSRTGAKLSSNALNKSMDLTDKTTKSSATAHPGMAFSSLRRMSIPDRMTKPLQKAASDVVRLASLDEIRRVEFDGVSRDDNPIRMPNLFPSNSAERTIMTPAVRSQSLPSPGSHPPSPNKTSVSPSVYRGASPARTRSLNSAPPSRGSSPSRIRSYSSSGQYNNSTSVLSFIADIKKGKKVANHIEDVHELRLLYNRHLQWRYVNARADDTLYYQKVTAEKTLYNVWRTILELWDSVTEKRIDLQQLRLQLMLYSVLNEQMSYLDEWALIEGDLNCSLSGAIEDLQASTLRLPVTGGARAEIESMRAAIVAAVRMMQTMGSSICSILSRVEGMNCLVAELADVATEERAMLDECLALLASTVAMQVEEYSIRTHLIQFKQARKSGKQQIFGN